MPRKKSINYVNNKDLYQYILVYKSEDESISKKEKDKAYEKICLAIMQISKRLCTRPNFNGYTFRDEMICDAIEAGIKSIRNFDPRKTENPFAYFTMVAWNSFITRIKEEEKQSFIKHKNLHDFYALELESEIFNSGQLEGAAKLKESSIEIIKKFEEKMKNGKR